MEDMLQVGVVASTHGIKGEVKVFPTTNDAMRFKKLKKVIVDTGNEKLELEIEGVKFFKQFVILKFKGIDSINDIEKYKTKALLISRADAVPCEEDEYFIADLIGMLVENENGEPLGILKDVMETGANDVYIVSMAEDKEVLLPAIKQCILNVDMKERKMKVHLLEGLL